MLSNEQYNQVIEKRQEARYLYLGLLSAYQSIKQDLKQHIVYTKLNPHQHFLFKRIIHGLKMYKQDIMRKVI